MSRGLCRISLLFSCLFVTRRWTRGALEQHRTPVRGFLAASFLYSAKALVDRHSSDLSSCPKIWASRPWGSVAGHSSVPYR